MPITDTAQDVVRNLPAVAAATLGGWVFSLIDAPLPWFFGSLFVIAIANLLGWRARAPRGRVAETQSHGRRLHLQEEPVSEALLRLF